MPHNWIISSSPEANRGGGGMLMLKLANNGPKKGDCVYLYRQHEGDLDPGIYALGEVEGVYSNQIALRVNQDFLSNKRQFIKETTLLRDPGLQFKKETLPRHGEARRLSASEALRLKLLAKKAGKDYDAIDSMRCLLAYEDCVSNGLGIDNSEPVRLAALETGRLLTSVAFKLANFRSLDPRTDNAGFEGAAAVDRAAWEKYYQPTERRIDIDRLRSDLAYSEFIDPDLFIISPEDEKEDADLLKNDDDARQTYARRVRRGQSRFRKALLTLYSNQCAFTGVFEDRVLEACHILPHAHTGNNQLDNGLILRADLHTLFDLRLATVDSDGSTIRISPEVSDPEFSRLNLTKQRRAGITDEHKVVLAIRNRDISWLD